MERSTPWSWYTDAEVLRREQDRIFARAWQYAGHTGEVAEPGSYLTARAGLAPVVVTHARDGELRAFLNVCRHRGFPVAQGAGRRETLQCGYHAWTYGLDGRLLAAPRSAREQGFDATALGLVPARVDTWGPLVFVNLDPDAPPLPNTLLDLPERLAAAGVDVATLEFRLRAEASLEANWKLACENFLECYHCPVAHPGFTDLVDVSPDSYVLEAGETFSTQTGPARDADVGDEVPRAQFHLIWPNTGINVFPGRPNLSIGPIVPDAPGRTVRFLDYFFAPGVDDAWIEDLLQLDEQIGREDTALVEGAQRGVAAGALAEGRLLSDAEHLLVDFQARVAAALA